MPNRKTTKKSAAVKRGTTKSEPIYTVADFRASLEQATAQLIAIQVWLDQKVNEIAKAKQ